MNLVPRFSGSSIGLLQFPGSNCDQDCIETFRRHFDLDLQLIWHTETKLPSCQALIIPGGFSYGDYLRGGGLAAHSPVMGEVRQFVQKGGPVLGICNGFQVLTESKLLPGTLLPNASRKFVCETVALQVESGSTIYHRELTGQELCIPVAHAEGRFYIDEVGYKTLAEEGQILFRYRNNPNGSVGDIAGITALDGQIMGMMPHPERAPEALLGGDDGLKILRAFLSTAL